MSDDILSQEEIDALLRRVEDESFGSSEFSEQEKKALVEVADFLLQPLLASVSPDPDAVRMEFVDFEQLSSDRLALELAEPGILVSVDFVSSLGESSFWFVVDTTGAHMLSNILDASLDVDFSSLIPSKEEVAIFSKIVEERASDFLRDEITALLEESVELSGFRVSILPADLADLGQADMIKLRYVLNGGRQQGNFGFFIFEDWAGLLLDYISRENQVREVPKTEPPKPKSKPERKRPSVNPVEFAEVESSGTERYDEKLDLIMDVPLEITVELGRTRKQIKEILSLGPGAILELDRLAGETVDLLVNGKLIAKGEVVVIDENFGIRITDILSPAERINYLR